MSIKDELLDHMKRQPYVIKCEVCSEFLESKTEVDSDLDMSMTVTPCPTCCNGDSDD